MKWTRRSRSLFRIPPRLVAFRAVTAVCLAAVVAVVALGCGSSQKGAIALSLPTLKTPLLQQVATDTRALVERQGYTFLADDPDNKLVNEARDWDAWIARGDVKVIMGFPLDVKGIIPVTQRARDAGITVLGYSDDWPGTSAALVSDALGDGEKLGRDAGAWIRLHYGSKRVRVAVLATQGSPLERQRDDGVQRGVKQVAPNAHIDVLPAALLREPAYTDAREEFVAHPDTKVWLSISVDGILGARKALLDSGVRPTDPSIFMGTIDADPEALGVLRNRGDILRVAYYFPASKIAAAISGLMLRAARHLQLADVKLVPDRVTAANAKQYT